MNLPRGKTLPAPGVLPRGAQRYPPTSHEWQARPARVRRGSASLRAPSHYRQTGPALGLASRTPVRWLWAPVVGQGGTVRPGLAAPAPQPRAPPPPAPRSLHSLPLRCGRLLHGGRGQKEGPDERRREERIRGARRPSPGNHRGKLQELGTTFP